MNTVMITENSLLMDILGYILFNTTPSSPGFRANSTGTYLDQVTGYIMFTIFFLLPKMFLSKFGIVFIGSSTGTYKPIYGFSIRTVN